MKSRLSITIDSCYSQELYDQVVRDGGKGKRLIALALLGLQLERMNARGVSLDGAAFDDGLFQDKESDTENSNDNKNNKGEQVDDLLTSFNFG